MFTLQTIGHIDPLQPKTWNAKLFLTFDTDWCSDDVLAYTLDILDKYEAKATVFITHDTPLLQRMRQNKNIELGIHPNFNPLLNGDFRFGSTADDVIAYYKALVPDATALRSHSLTVNSRILDLCTHYGITHECNSFISYEANMALKPWYHWDKQLVRVPYAWADDVHSHCNWQWDKSDTFINSSGINVFAFHPIMIYLNAENLERYRESKEAHHNIQKLKHYRNTRIPGAEDFLLSLLQTCQSP